MLGRTDHIEAIECNLREKTIAPDFRYPMQDARLSLARLCALQERYQEGVEWFDKARAVLDEQGARPMRAIVDFDEAWMYLRRSASGDRERARPAGRRGDYAIQIDQDERMAPPCRRLRTRCELIAEEAHRLE
jgi:hypothetical protein